MDFNYYYGTQADQFSFIRIPKVMLTGEMFSPLSLQAKVLYGLFLDRMALSMKNGWLDKENKVYIIYQIADIQEDLGFSKKKAIDYLAELEKFGLIEKKRRGLGLASIIYVKSFLLEKEGINALKNGTSRSIDLGTSVSADNNIENVDNIGIHEESSGENEVQTVKTTPISRESERKHYRGVEVGTSRSVDLGTSRGTEIVLQEVMIREPQEVPKRGPLNNNTNINNTNINILKSNHIPSVFKTEMRSDEMNAYSELIKENIDYDFLLTRYPYEHELVEGIYDLILETVFNQSKNILIASNQYPVSLVQSKFLKLDSSHVEYVISCLQSNTTKVKNIKKYLLAALFNAPTTIKGYYQAEVNHDMPQFAKSR